MCTLDEMPVKEKIDKLLDNSDKNLGEDYYKEVKERLEFTYNYEEATKIPTVITVTELKALEANKSSKVHNENDLYIDNSDLNEDDYKDLNYEETEGIRKFKPLMQTPLFLQEKKGLTPSEVGTAYHNVMQRLDLSGDITEEGIKKQVNDMVDKELITFEAS